MNRFLINVLKYNILKIYSPSLCCLGLQPKTVKDVWNYTFKKDRWEGRVK